VVGVLYNDRTGAHYNVQIGITGNVYKIVRSKEERKLQKNSVYSVLSTEKTITFRMCVLVQMRNQFYC